MNVGIVVFISFITKTFFWFESYYALWAQNVYRNLTWKAKPVKSIVHCNSFIINYRFK